MMKVGVWYLNQNGLFRKELRYLKPRKYMLSWDFDRSMKYIRKELSWQTDIKESQVMIIEFSDEDSNWTQSIKCRKR